MSIARARIESKSPMIHSGMNYEEKESEKWRVFKEMMAKFRKLCSDNSIAYNFRQHERYESRGMKKRRRKHELRLQALKNKLKENFIRTETFGKENKGNK